MTNWPRYGILAAAYAAQLRETVRHPVVAGTGLVFGTYAEQLTRVRGSATVEDLVPVALRRWRKQSGYSQRVAAQVLGVTPGLVARAESRPWVLKMESVLSVLRPAGYDLVVVDQDGVPLAEDLRSEEVLARTASGRRFPATSEVVRLTNEPRWMAKRGQSFQSHGPQWTGEKRPGQYP
ncbi:MAG: hypothetical protein DCC50_09625 [Acidobacteria bacterium]|nr:MAG: hypothetical protein DCC50_09625 [Acidobacteriota bacterium]